MDDLVAIGVPGVDQGGLVRTSQLQDGTTVDVSAGQEGALSFGSSVDLVRAVDGLSLMVGAPETEQQNIAFGSAEYYTFDGEAQAWVRLGSPMRPPSTELQIDGQFGFEVSMATTIRRVVVGAPFSLVNLTIGGVPRLFASGRIFTFDFDGTDWVEPSNALEGSPVARIGQALDLSHDGTYLLTGAPVFEGTNGAFAYYQWNETGMEWETVFALAGTDNEELGASVAILSDSAEWIAVGSPSFGTNQQGSIRAYGQFGNTYVPLGNPIQGLQEGERIGTTLAGRQGRLCFGTTSTNTVRIYDYRPDDTDWIPVSSISVPLPIVAVALSEDGTTVAVTMVGDVTEVYAFL